MAVLAPMPMASVITARKVKPRCLASMRSAKRRSDVRLVTVPLINHFVPSRGVDEQKLFEVERNHRIDARSAPRRDVAGQRSHTSEQHSHKGKRRWVMGRN